MKKDVCDYCGKAVCIFDHPTIHGWFDLRQQADKTAGLRWFGFSNIGGREKEVEYEGHWCDFECLAKDLAKRLNRKFDGLYPASSGLFDCSVAKRQTFCSTPAVNKTDDMIRVTLDMTRNEWRRLQAAIKQSNSEAETSE